MEINCLSVSTSQKARIHTISQATNNILSGNNDSASAIPYSVNSDNGNEVRYFAVQESSIFNSTANNNLLEDIGFTDDNITEYVNRFFRANAKVADECLMVIRQNPAVWRSVHIPIILEIICNIWSTTLKEELTKISLPALYKLITDNLWLRYLLKTDPNARLEDVSHKTTFLANDLSQLAALGFYNNEIILSSATLQVVYKNGNYKQIPFSKWCKLLEQSNFVRPIVNGSKQGIQPCFTDLSFQEYFAGQYYALKFIANPNEVREFFISYQYSTSHRLMYKFMVGYLYHYYKTTHNATPLLSYWEVVLNSIDMRGEDYFGFVMDSLESCGIERNLIIHENLFQQIQAILFDDKYNNLLVTRPQLLRECLLNINSKLTSEQIRILGNLYRVNKIDKINLPEDSNLIKQLLQLINQDSILRMDACWLLDMISHVSHQVYTIIRDIVINVVKDPKCEKKEAICYYLGHTSCKGDSIVINVLLSMLDNQDSDVLYSVHDALRELSGKDDQKVINVLLRIIKNQNSELIYYACDTLCEIASQGNSKVINVLLGILNGQESSIIECVCNTLGKLSNKGNQAVINTLLGKLRDSNEIVRKSACTALSEVSNRGNELIINALLDMLDDQQVRYSACNALCCLANKGGQRFIKDALFGRLKNHKWRVRCSACYVLGKISDNGDKKLIRVVISMLADRGCDVREAACSALGQVAHKGDNTVIFALIAMLEDKSDNVRKSACNALGKVSHKGDQRVIDALLISLNDRDESVEKSAYKVLCNIANKDDPKVINILINRFEYPDSSVRREAYQDLIKLTNRGNPTVIKALLSIIKKLDSDIAIDTYIIHYAYESLSELSNRGDYEVIDTLLSKLGDPGKYIRYGACNALKAILPPVLREYVGRLIQHVPTIFDGLSNIVIYNKGLDIYCANEKVTIDKHNPMYPEWLQAVKEFALQNSHQIVDIVLETGYNPAL